MRGARTWMFVPGSDVRKLEKVAQSPVDAIIYDLEDAVAREEKAMARDLVKAELHKPSSPDTPARFVRVNAMDTPYCEQDVKACLASDLRGIVLPKAEETDAIVRLDEWLSEWEASEASDGQRGQQRDSLEIVPLIESARGLHHAYEIARSSKRVQRLMFGSIDFALDISAELTTDGLELLYARSQLVVVSRAAGIGAPIDAVYPHFHDKEGLIRETQRAKRLGFEGKLLIHPSQIAAVRDVFAPSREELGEAESIVAAYEAAVVSGIGSIQIGGKMVDLPVYERAKRIVDEAQERKLSLHPNQGEER
ncbi:CoA ester lyase [Brevibacillus nitrificans]|uniref:HpcH/HpaI aldolase/citrate lyase family protein n=1 Tax=Brevibacillus nitrificans TaxID=651560 RepID=UPI00285D4179|nr:CoA ester lyase [Brevibacillus nitrificans]MDR7314649.1 citrate lyase subunit beta/citryl-CoA lyase [Brevibacillus nitrificans]